MVVNVVDICDRLGIEDFSVTAEEMPDDEVGISSALEWLVREARRDDDFQIAHLAEKVLARHEARKMRPGFAWPATRSQTSRGRSSANSSDG